MLRWGLARAIILRRFPDADHVHAHGHGLCYNTKGLVPRGKLDVTVTVATTAVQRTGRDEDNHVCGVQDVHTRITR